VSRFEAGIGSVWTGARDAAAASRSRETGSVRRGAGVAAFVLAIATAGALAHVAVRIKGLEVAYDLGRERRIATEMEEQRRRLQIEIGMLKDPARVISIARDKLNMGPPTPDAIWRLGSGEPARPGVAPKIGEGKMGEGRMGQGKTGDGKTGEGGAAKPRPARSGGTR
jgi:cell division protein FtsL